MCCIVLHVRIAVLEPQGAASFSMRQKPESVCDSAPAQKRDFRSCDDIFGPVGEIVVNYSGVI
jgi:hypothetical protein